MLKTRAMAGAMLAAALLAGCSAPGQGGAPKSQPKKTSAKTVKDATPTVTAADKAKVYSLGGRLAVNAVRFKIKYNGHQNETIAQLVAVTNKSKLPVYAVKIPVLKKASGVTCKNLGGGGPWGFFSGGAKLHTKDVTVKIPGNMLHTEHDATFTLKSPIQPGKTGEVEFNYSVPFKFNRKDWTYTLPADIVSGSEPGVSGFSVSLPSGYPSHRVVYFAGAARLKSISDHTLLQTAPIKKGNIMDWMIGRGKDYPHFTAAPDGLPTEIHITKAEKQKVYSLGGKIKLADLRILFGFDGGKPEIVTQLFAVENFGSYPIYNLEFPLLSGAHHTALLAPSFAGWAKGVKKVPHTQVHVVKGAAVYHLKKPLMPKVPGQRPHFIITVLQYRVPFNFPGHWRYTLPADVVTAATSRYPGTDLMDAGLAGGYKPSHYKVSSTMSTAKNEQNLGVPLGVYWKLPIKEGTVLHWTIGPGPKFPYSGPPPLP